VIGLTGGIGSGKSTVASLLAGRGAVVVDADLIAREVVEPGGSAYAPIVERFGPGVLAADGRLDRAALASVVFSDPEALAALEAITHPAIQGEMARRVAAHDGSDDVVIMDIPLLKDRRRPMAGVVVVDVPEEVAVRRLVEQRGFDERDARRRIAAQISREQRRSLADVVVEIDRVWTWIEGLMAGGAAAEAVTDRR